ncbi:MAG TPA: hypothetical protein VNR11_05480 [Xanthobacteraceae bacterium]|nr:hypothetical protein [Xanthobacteraceae bacterium]
MPARQRQPKPAASWPLYEVPQQGETPPFADGDTSQIIDDMVSVLSTSRHGSTAEALAFLRQVYPRYPLTLRLAALVAHAKIMPALESEPTAN